ncbi:Speckle-type POZ protein B [Folsomia candida]|uniref:Speckle-type POZ protein B n=1 Tax=Folsomia candida TaxID=158441 RepID=A0A226DDW4_FOLCA|nr:Speckle-type POZ protein B [Folsomia candida]
MLTYFRLNYITCARQAVNAERELIQRLRDRGLNNNLAGRGRRVEPVPIPPANANDAVGFNMAGREDRGNGNAASRNAYNAASNSTVKRKAPSYGPESVEAWAATEMEQETFAFLWTLKGYSSFSGSGTCTEEVKSPVFRGGPKSQHQWQLKMSPKKKSEDLEYFAVRFQISLLDSDGRPGKQAGSGTMNVCEFKRCSVWGYDKFILTSDLLAPARRLIDEDTLKIHCRVWIEGEVKHKTGNGGAYSPNLIEEDRVVRQKDLLSKELSVLLQTTEFADVALTTKTRTFMAHKAVLAARSKVFSAMFSSKMLESTMNTVEIPDFDEDVVEGMLEFMYSGQVEGLHDPDKASALLRIAEKYDLPGLKEECEHNMAENLNVDTAITILVMAHIHNAALLKLKVIDFINRNKDDVKKTKAFKEVAVTNASVFVDLYLSQK